MEWTAWGPLKTVNRWRGRKIQPPDHGKWFIGRVRGRLFFGNNYAIFEGRAPGPVLLSRDFDGAIPDLREQKAVSPVAVRATTEPVRSYSGSEDVYAHWREVRFDNGVAMSFEPFAFVLRRYGEGTFFTHSGRKGEAFVVWHQKPRGKRRIVAAIMPVLDT